MHIYACAPVSYAYMCVCLCELCTPHAGRSLQRLEEGVRTEVVGGSAAKQTQVLCKSGHSIAERGRERD